MTRRGSHHTYLMGLDCAAADYPFYSLIQAAMRQADNDNLARLMDVFPWVYEELEERKKAGGGYLPGEVPKARDA